MEPLLLAQHSVSGTIVAVSPDGSRLVVKEPQQLVYRDLLSGEITGFSRTLCETPWQLQAEFSADGEHVAFHDWESCTLYNISHDRLIAFYRALHPAYGLVGSVEFLGSDQLLLGETQAEVFTLEGKRLHTLAIGQATQAARRAQPSHNPIQQIATVSARGRLASSDGDSLRLWDPATGGPPLAARPGRYDLLTWSPDGLFLAVRQEDRLQVFNPHGDEVWEQAGDCHLLVFSPTHAVLMVLKETLQILCAATGQSLAHFPQFNRRDIRGAGFLADGRLYLNRPESLEIWQLRPTSEARWVIPAPWTFPPHLPPLGEIVVEEPPPEATVDLSVTLPASLHARLQAWSTMHECTPDQAIEQALRSHLEQ